MADTESYFVRWKRASLAPKMLLLLGLSTVLSGVGCFAYWQFAMKPQLEAAQTHYRAHIAMMRLWDLQKAYHAAHGTYANDLDSVLAGAPDADKLRETLKNNTDINTLVVRGDEKRFRLEANILDSERTLLKFRGPTGGL
jgi:hypothetical protein